jgi:hypothetical protein
MQSTGDRDELRRFWEACLIPEVQVDEAKLVAK